MCHYPPPPPPPPPPPVIDSILHTRNISNSVSSSFSSPPPPPSPPPSPPPPPLHKENYLRDQRETLSLFFPADRRWLEFPTWSDQVSCEDSSISSCLSSPIRRKLQ
ncbi:unnamed protein product [Pleuronectes platessa]|uniref:Uncharacterized protein n=1 Tax=Pleuronectes platessa TaxID=8262 RepID=A0A9N7YQQ5_PLEPL|nr:unnamed protein product [Pleuronectes platessa]